MIRQAGRHGDAVAGPNVPAARATQPELRNLNLTDRQTRQNPRPGGPAQLASLSWACAGTGPAGAAAGPRPCAGPARNCHAGQYDVTDHAMGL